MKIQIIKRDGTTEEYGEFKVTRVVIAAGLKSDQAQALTSSVTKWLKSQPTSKYSSLQIRDKVIQELKKINQDAANMYSWYEKTKD